MNTLFEGLAAAEYAAIEKSSGIATARKYCKEQWYNTTHKLDELEDIRSAWQHLWMGGGTH